MNKGIKEKIIRLSYELRDSCDSDKHHLSFIVRKNKILSIGWNSSKQTHTISKIYGYPFIGVHSEVRAILNYENWQSDLKKCTLINVRINNNDEISMSKPCPHCEKLIEKIGFKRVYFTNFDGEFERFK